MAAAEVSAGAAVGAGFLAARSASRPLHAAMKIVDAEAAYALTQFLKKKVINIFHHVCRKFVNLCLLKVCSSQFLSWVRPACVDVG
jgi:hypothetical protein